MCDGLRTDRNQAQMVSLLDEVIDRFDRLPRRLVDKESTKIHLIETQRLLNVSSMETDLFTADR